MIELYKAKRRKEITNIPHMGITPHNHKSLCTQLKCWEDHINAKEHRNTKSEDLPPELGRGFGIWVKELKKTISAQKEVKKPSIV